jgi:hypothetical protein
VERLALAGVVQRPVVARAGHAVERCVGRAATRGGSAAARGCGGSGPTSRRGRSARCARRAPRRARRGWSWRCRRGGSSGPGRTPPTRRGSRQPRAPTARPAAPHSPLSRYDPMASTARVVVTCARPRRHPPCCTVRSVRNRATTPSRSTDTRSAPGVCSTWRRREVSRSVFSRVFKLAQPESHKAPSATTTPDATRRGVTRGPVVKGAAAS